MAKLKTAKNSGSVTAFLASIDDPQRKRDCKVVAKMMREATGARASMWGKSVVGYGSYRFRYADGKESEWFLVGFSPRKQSLTLYVLYGLKGIAGRLKKLGPHTTGKSCLYIKRLEAIDLDVLRELIDLAVERKRKISL